MRLHYNLLQASTYSVGLAYELLVMDVLQKYSFQLKHIGGSGDKGQDFIGYWTLPNKKIAVVGIVCIVVLCNNVVQGQGTRFHRLLDTS